MSFSRPRDVADLESQRPDRANPDQIIFTACLKRVEGLRAVPLGSLVALTAAAIPKRDDIKMHQGALIIAVIVLTCLQTPFGYLLAMFARYMSRSSWKLPEICQHLLHIVIVSYHGISLILTALFLVALLEFKILWFSLFLFPILFIMFIICVLMYVGIKVNDNGGHITSDEAFENVVKNCFDVASFVTKETTFPTLLVVFIGQLVNPLPIPSTSPYLSLFLSVNVITFMFAAFSMMVTSLPVILMSSTVKSKLVVGMKKIKKIMVILTIIMVMILGGRFLDGVVFLALLPEVMIYTLHQTVILLGEIRDGPEENSLNDEPEIPSLFTDVGKGCVVLISVIYMSYSGRDTYDSDLKVSVFILVAVSIVSFSRLIFTLTPPAGGDRRVIYVLKSITFIFPGSVMLVAFVFLLKIAVNFYKTP